MSVSSYDTCLVIFGVFGEICRSYDYIERAREREKERGRERERTKRERERSTCIQSHVWPPSEFLVASDRYTDTDTHAIGKELAEGQL